MFFGKLKQKYKNKYGIPYQDLRDSNESNRISVLVVSSILLLSDIINILLLLIFHHAHLNEQLHYFIYLAIYTPLNLYTFLHARHSKNSKYWVKVFPIYLVLFVGLSASVFNFYFMETPHNGFLTYYLSGFLFLIVFSFSPFIYLFELLTTAIILTPGVYKTYGFLSSVDLYVVTVIMFGLSMYKRSFEKKHFLLLKKQKKSLEAKTFGNFTILYDNKVIKFSRKKSTELIAYLIYKNGSSVKTNELINVLWGERADSSQYGANFRNLIVDVKHTLSELEIQNFFITEYNNFRINPEVVQCDYYDFLAGNEQAIKSYAGEFMSQYSWAEEVAGFLEMKALKNH
ncbi:MAG: hypothetical protein K6G09_03015 [Treponema sp.]|nr:hypothetical protein [Treponema sp.]